MFMLSVVHTSGDSWREEKKVTASERNPHPAHFQTFFGPDQFLCEAVMIAILLSFVNMFVLFLKVPAQAQTLPHLAETFSAATMERDCRENVFSKLKYQLCGFGVSPSVEKRTFYTLIADLVIQKAMKSCFCFVLFF